MDRQPNILFLLTDQQRADTLACYGNSRVRTPHLNALADSSFVFENAYVSQPICTPSRSTIMTGMYPHATGCLRNNIPLDPSVPTLAEMLPDDYVSAYYGKWHLGNEVARQRGFGSWISTEDQYRRYYSDPALFGTLSDYHHFLEREGLTPDVEDKGALTFSREMAARLPEELTKAHFLAERTIEFLRDHRDKRFALYVSFLEPHPPYVGPLDALYARSDIDFGPSFLQPPSSTCSKLHLSRAKEFDEMSSKWDRDREEMLREIKSQYWANVSLIDRSIGLILSALEELGLADDTVVAFTSEHGDQLGEHGILQKATLYEESMKVPMLLRVPWMARSSGIVPGRFSHVDLVPTLLDLIGETVPSHLHGETRVPVLLGQEHLGSVIVEWNGRNLAPHPAGEEMTRAQNTPFRVMVDTDGWKLALSAADRCELYDLNADPSELNNRFGDPAQLERIAHMTDGIRAWQERVGDRMPLVAN